MRNPWPPAGQARDFVAAKTRRGRIGHRSRRNLAANFAQRNRHSEVRLPTIRVTERDREGVELTVAILKKFQEAATAQKENFYVIFIPYMPHVEKHFPYNHPLVPVIAAGLTRQGVTYREPYPACLKAAIVGGHPFNKNDRHFSAEGRALFAKFLTDTELAQASVDYYKHPH